MRHGRPLHIDWAEEDTAAALERRFRRETDARRAQRLRALWLIRGGETLRATAALVGVTERIVRRWVAWYRQGGLAAVLGHRPGGPGRASYLTAEQQAALREHLVSGAVYTAKDAVAWVAEQFGVTYQPKGIYGVLHRLTAHPKVPRPHNPKSTPEQQEAWKKGGSPRRSRQPASRSRRGSAGWTNCGWGCAGWCGGCGRRAE
jgi:transposase